MFEHLNVVAAGVFIFFFSLVTIVGFLASRWRRGDLDSIGEWGLGGRQFGPWVTWFLLGGDLYTAYTVIAVPAVIYGIGAYGFFAVPYTIVIYPFLYLTMPRLWAVTHRHGYLTAADFVLGRYGNRPLELAVAMTGIIATMPYIALQLVGLEKVIGALGFQGEGDLCAFADHHRLRDPRALHLQKRAARAGVDRVRQGRDDLRVHHRRDHRDPVSAGRGGPRSSRPRRTSMRPRLRPARFRRRG